MSLFDTLVNQSNEIDNKQKIVEDEIVNYFSELLKDEEKIKSCFTNENLRVRKKAFTIQFWEYMSGCSGTYFGLGPFRWNNPENASGYESCRYKGVELRDIQQEVVQRICGLVRDYFSKQGFRVSYEDIPNRLDFSEIILTIRW